MTDVSIKANVAKEANVIDKIVATSTATAEEAAPQALGDNQLSVNKADLKQLNLDTQ